MRFLFRWLFRKKNNDASSYRDPRNKDYSVQETVKGMTLTSKRWECPIRLDQGREGACVAFGLSHTMASQPFSMEDITNKTAKVLYKRIQRNDRLPGEAYSGTFVEDGLKLLKKDGTISSYLWSLSLEDALLSLSNLGPLVAKIPMYSKMYRPAWSGQIKPEGKRQGYHCVEFDEIDVENRRVWILNSWGRRYGVDGRIWLTFEDFEYLLQHRGVVASMVE